MDHRKFSRVPFQIEATLKHNDSVITGDVTNLSLQGLFVTTDEKLKIGSIVNITIHLLGSASRLALEMMGTVQRIENDGFAVRFTDIDIDSFIHLKSIVAYNMGDPDLVEDEFRSYIKEQKEEKEE